MLSYSFDYWKKHKKSFWTISSVLTLGFIMLFLVLSIIRGIRVRDYENSLDENGNYNYLLNISDTEELESVDEYFDNIGIIYKYGYVSNPSDSNKSYLIGICDDNAESLWHWSCEDGRYPIKDNEIAIDKEAVKKLGYSPVVGTEIALRDVDGEIRKYKVSGILKSISRNVDSSKVTETPVGFVSKNYSGSEILFALGVEKKDASNLESLLNKNGISYYWDCAKAMVDSFYLESDIISENENSKKITTANIADFESAILVPILAILLCMVVIFVTSFVLKNSIYRRRTGLSYMCLIGLKKSKARRILFCELFIISVVSWIMGMIFSILIYKIIIILLANVLNINVYDAYNANSVIKAVTFDPMAVSSICLWSSIGIILIIEIIKWRDISPLESIRSQAVGVGRYVRINKRKDFKKIGNYLKFGKVNSLIMIFVIFVMLSVSFFSCLYLYCSHNADLLEYEEELANANMKDFDYVLSRDFTKAEQMILCTNRWNSGITSSNLEKIKKNDCVENTEACIQMPEINLIETDEEKATIFGESLIEYETNSKTIPDLVKKSDNLNGYSDEDRANLYNVSMIAMDDLANCFEKENISVVSGKIDESKVDTGEEIVLVVANKKILQSVKYNVGDYVNFTDVVIGESDKAYSHDFSDGTIVEDEGQSFNYTYEDKIYTARTYGYRTDFKVKIGAIVVVDDMSDNFYYISSRRGNNNVQFITSVNALQKYGLPHKNYTKIGVISNGKSYNTKLVSLMYDIYSESIDINLRTTYEIKKEISEKNTIYLVECFLLILILISMCFIAIKRLLMLELLDSKNIIARIRLCGVKSRKIRSIIRKKFYVFLLIDYVLAWIPFGLFCLKEEYIASESKKILEYYGVEGEISSDVILGGGEYKTSWLYNLRGGHYDFLSQPYFVIYLVCMFICTVMIIWLVNHLVNRFMTSDILRDDRLEE